MLPPPLSLAQLQMGWADLLGGRFVQEDVEAFLAATHRDLSPGSLLRQVGQLMAEEAFDADLPLAPLVLEMITNWPMTQRIDGIMPMLIPRANDVVMIVQRFFLELEALGLDAPPLESMERLECEFSLCLLAWFHQRPLKSSHGMAIELTTQCPASAMARRSELSVMGSLPNGGRITVFYSSLRAEIWSGESASSIEHFPNLTTKRTADGRLVLVGDERAPRLQRRIW